MSRKVLMMSDIQLLLTYPQNRKIIKHRGISGPWRPRNKKEVNLMKNEADGLGINLTYDNYDNPLLQALGPVISRIKIFREKAKSFYFEEILFASGGQDPLVSGIGLWKTR